MVQSDQTSCHEEVPTMGCGLMIVEILGGDAGAPVGEFQRRGKPVDCLVPRHAQPPFEHGESVVAA